ncbi:hypothetical protein I8H89_03215 [Candidatus Saccharibacteria bacterium]|nr:hypothetical protein [Candidatus Saccharibacteria bacterium]
MNLQPDTGTTNISDDQELAKVLAGVNGGPTVDDTAADVDYEETSTAPEPVAIAPEPIAINPLPIAANPVPSRDDLEGVKMEAINELRPLIDKLDLPPEEKFDTYLLLIRCTDDKELVPPAHEVAKLISDDARRAMALLDIIKEIDYLSSKAPSDAPSADDVSLPTPDVAPLV